MSLPKDKKKFLLWARGETIKRVEQWYKQDGCKTRSGFIEKAINFYCGYLTSNNAWEYLPEVITSTVRATIESFESRMARILFKLAVETSMMMHVTAASNEIDEEVISELRGLCVNEVKGLNGRISFEEIVKFQNE